MKKNLTLSFLFIGLITLTGMLASCTKQTPGYYIASTKVTSVIQFSANGTSYAIQSAPDVISFKTTAVNATTPNFRQYLVSGINTNSTLSFSLSFHIDSLGSGKYKMESARVVIGSKSYLSLASKSTDKVSVTTLDASKNTYNGTFSFYAFNQSSATDSVLVTGAYGIQL